MLMEGMAGLNLVERDDDILEKGNVLLSQGNCESGDNGGQNVQEFRSSIEFEVLVDEAVETVVDGLSDHLSSGNQLGIESVKDVLQVLSLSGLFRVEQFQKLLDEGRSDVHLQGFDVSPFTDNELKEEFIDWLKVRPSWVDQQLFLLHSDSLSRKSGLFQNGKRPEDVLFDHLDDEIQMGNNYVGHTILVGKVVIELLKVGLPIGFFFDLLGIVVEVERSTTCLKFFQELIP